jgi:hypothetical protein
MQLQERVRSARDDAKIRVRDARLDKADRDRDRLKTENEILKARLDGTTEERARWMEAIDELSSRPADVNVKIKKHRLRRLFVLGAAAGSAYVIGAKAGRERYEQLRSWFDGMRNRGDDASWASDSARMSSMPSGESSGTSKPSTGGSYGSDSSSPSSTGSGSNPGSSTRTSSSGGSSPGTGTSKSSGSSTGSSSSSKGSTPG